MFLIVAHKGQYYPARTIGNNGIINTVETLEPDNPLGFLAAADRTIDIIKEANKSLIEVSDEMTGEK